MKERIYKLAVQVGIIKEDEGYFWIHSVDELEKLAELIVVECATICYNSSFRDADAHAQNLLYEFNIDNCRSEK